MANWMSLSSKVKIIRKFIQKLKYLSAFNIFSKLEKEHIEYI